MKSLRLGFIALVFSTSPDITGVELVLQVFTSITDGKRARKKSTADF